MHVVGNTIYKFGGAYGSWECAGEGGLHVYSSAVSDPSQWTDHGAVLPAKFSYGGISAIVGDSIYLFSSACGSNIFKAPLSDPIHGWVDTGIPMLSSSPYFVGLVEDSDNLYLMGGGAANDEIWAASKADPLTWSDTAFRLPGSAQYKNLIEKNGTVYIVGYGANLEVWKAPTASLSSWERLTTSANIPANAGTALVIGEYAYILGGHNDDAVYRAPFSDIQKWEVLSVRLPPQGFWGYSWIRITDSIYVFGGDRSDPNDGYRGNSTIIRADISYVTQ